MALALCRSIGKGSHRHSEVLLKYRSFVILSHLRTSSKMSEKSLSKGSECPALEKDKIRLYSMRFCPYVKRVRLVLAEKNVQFETVNINLTEKPEWYLKRFPDGKVPVLEQNDKQVFESLIISDYLDEFCPGEKLHPIDPYRKAADQYLLSKFSKVSDNWGRAVHKPAEAKEAFQDVILGLEFFETELAKRRSKFFGGSRPQMLDLMIWPWFELLMSGEHFLGQGYEFEIVLANNKFPVLCSWVKSMSGHPSIKKLMNIENQNNFAESVKAGNRNYDVGL
uniref:Glutathione transferase n=1 Tax=Strigamia maritima TaxID=126957 RepID=T1IUU7_STRMM